MNLLNTIAHSSGRRDTPTPEHLVKPQQSTVSMEEWIDRLESSYALLPISGVFAASDTATEGLAAIFKRLDSLDPLPWEKPILTPELPGFVIPVQTEIHQGTHERLIANGALMMPSIPLQNALLQTFVEYVFPYSPVIEWQQFLGIVAERRGNRGQISLLLFHAVLLSAVPFVGLDPLFKAGYQSRQDAYASYFRKIMLLFQSGYETDIVTTLQTLYLMASSSEASGCRSRGLEVEKAIFLAQSNGLFSPNVAFPCSPKLRSRLTWAYYIMGCHSSFRSRCLSRVTTDFRLPMLSEDDFDLSSPSIEARRLFPHCVPIQREKVQRDMARICISMAQLCVCIANVLEIQGKPISPADGSPNMRQQNPSAYVSGIYNAEKALTSWKDTLSPVCKFEVRHPVSGDISDRTPSILVQRCLLHMLYYSTLSVLHQSYLFPSSGTTMYYAAGETTELASQLEEGGLHRFLPVVGVTAVLIAMLTYVSHIQGSGTIGRNRVMDDFHRCRRVMESLQDIYSDAGLVNEWVLRMMDKPQSIEYEH